MQPTPQSAPRLNQFSRCSVESLPHQEVRFAIDGRELTRWVFSLDAPRPYFYPVCGPSGISLTRLGHPGAPNHDHHRSLWFAHDALMGTTFWTEDSPARIRQSQWYAVDEQDEYGRLVVELHWLDGHDPTPLVKQDLFITIRPEPSLGGGAWSLELQSDFRATGEAVEFRQSNFGILGLRVARSLSVVFGGGKIRGANGGTGEAALFGQPNRWISYSGPVGPANVAAGIGLPGRESLTLIDHADNPAPDNPSNSDRDATGLESRSEPWVRWHVRDDGWIGPSLTRTGPLAIPSNPTQALTIRYQLLVHTETAPDDAIQRLADAFDKRPSLVLKKSNRPHHQYEIL